MEIIHFEKIKDDIKLVLEKNPNLVFYRDFHDMEDHVGWTYADNPYGGKRIKVTAMWSDFNLVKINGDFLLHHEEWGIIGAMKGEDPILLFIAYMRYGLMDLLSYLTQTENYSYLYHVGESESYENARKLLKKTFKVKA